MSSIELSLAIQHLKKGNIIACPTETIWGLSCLASNEQSVSRMFEIKNRPPNKSLIVLVNNIKMVQQYVKNLTPLQKKHLENTEPTTVILNEIQNLPNSILAKDQTLAFRIVKHPLIVELIKKYNIKNLLITRSEKGMLLINSKSIKKIKADTKKVIDVTGAGDTVIATIALMLTLGLSVEDSIKISNYAAGIIIGKSGTASINYLDLIK